MNFLRGHFIGGLPSLTYSPEYKQLTWHDVEELSLDPPEEVGDARGEDAREGLLLEGGEVVLGDAADAHAARQGELAEALAQADQRRPHRERGRTSARGRTTDSVNLSRQNMASTT